MAKPPHEQFTVLQSSLMGGSWAIFYQAKPNAMRWPFLVAAPYVCDAEKELSKAADLLNQHWKD